MDTLDPLLLSDVDHQNRPPSSSEKLVGCKEVGPVKGSGDAQEIGQGSAVEIDRNLVKGCGGATTSSATKVNFKDESAVPTLATLEGFTW